MSFAAKNDYVGLSQAGLVLRSNGQNGTNGLLEIPGSDGSILGNEIYGHIKNPTCEYAISGVTQLSGLSLGKVHTPASLTGFAPFALSRLAVSTGAGAEPTVQADAVQIEPNATRTVCVYDLPATLSVTAAHHALTFGAFEYTETRDLVLQNGDFEATAEINPPTVNGEPVASDATGGRLTVNATMWTSAEEPPEVTANTAGGWTQTADWTCTGADSSMFSWTATFTKYLTAQQAS